jgi:hypothetical protein
MNVKCEVCGNLGQLQHLSLHYYRIKHYLGSVDGKLRFEYHRQSFLYVQGILSKDDASPIDPIDPNIDPKLLKNSSINESTSRGSLAWPGRQTHNLENNKRGTRAPSVQKSRARIPPHWRSTLPPGRTAPISESATRRYSSQIGPHQNFHCPP